MQKGFIILRPTAQLTVNVLPSRDADHMIIKRKEKWKKKKCMGSSATKNSHTPKKGSWRVTCSPRNFWLHTHRTLKLFIRMRSVARSPLEEYPKKGRSSTCKLHKLQWRTATRSSLGFLYLFSFILPFFLFFSFLFHWLNTQVIFTVPKKMNITIPNSKVMLLILAQIRKMLLAGIQWITKSQLQNH